MKYLTISPFEPYNYLLYEYCVEKDGTSQTDLVETKLMGWKVWKSRDLRITLEQAATPPVNTVICLSGFHSLRDELALYVTIMSNIV